MRRWPRTLRAALACAVAAVACFALSPLVVVVGSSMSAGFGGTFLLFIGACMTFAAMGLAAIAMATQSCRYGRRRWNATRAQ